MIGKFEIYKDKRGEFRFRLKASNGRIILVSEGYKAKAGVMNGVRSVRNNSQKDDRFERKKTKGGQFMFNLLAANRQVIGTSETYKSKVSRDKGIGSVKRNAPEAAVDDQTK